MDARPIETYVKPTDFGNLDRILVFGESSLTLDDDDDDGDQYFREWYSASWCTVMKAFTLDSEGYVVNVTHWMPLPEPPDSRI